MANISKINVADIDGEDMIVNLQDTVSGYTTKTGNKTKISTSNGLTGGNITTSGTVKCNLKSETLSTLATSSRGSTSSREYAVGLDANGDLSVNVPWTNTTLSTSNNNISISSGTISLTNVGTIIYKNASNVSSLANNTITQLTNITLPAGGRYVILGVARWAGHSNGVRELWLTTSSTGTQISTNQGFSRISCISSNGSDYIQHQVIYIRSTPTSGSDIFYLFGRQTSGAAIACNYPGIIAVRIA